MHDRPTRWPASRQILVLIGGLVIFQLVLTAATRSAVPGPAPLRGQDFTAFYNAARLTLAGHAAELYDLGTVRGSQARIEAEAGIVPGQHAFAPFLNPPHAALLFCPLAAAFGLRDALAIWTAFGVACLGASAWLMMRIVGGRPRDRWLCAAAVALAPPAWTALRYGQNTPLSLLLLVLAVAAWRGGRPALAGLACCALAYKPHLAGIVAAGCWLTMGRRVLIGLAAGGACVAAATLLLMPGALDAFVGQMPGNLKIIFFDREFPWQRHVTVNGFVRHLTHGNGPGPTAAWARALAAAIVVGVLVATGAAAWRLRGAAVRGDAAARDRLIALLVTATPLLMPYFIAYDLTLLLVAGATLAHAAIVEGVDPRGVRLAGMALYGWTLFNPIAAELSGISLTTPLIGATFALLVARCGRRPAAMSADRPTTRVTPTSVMRRAA